MFDTAKKSAPRVCKKFGIDPINPVGPDGCYIEGPWKGMLVFDADLEVIKYLKENDKLYKNLSISKTPRLTERLSFLSAFKDFFIHFDVVVC